MDNPELKQPSSPESAGNPVRVGSSPLGEKEAERLVLPPQLPVLPVKGLVLFPQVVLPVAVNEPRDVKLVNDVILGNRLMAMVAVKDESAEHPGPEHLYNIGCAVGVLKMMKFPDDTTRLFVQGISRLRIDQYTATDPYLTAKVTRLESAQADSIELRAQARSMVDQFQKLVDLSPHMPDELKLMALNIDDISRLADTICSTLNLNVPQRQEILETLDVTERLRKVNAHLSRELQTAELSTKITTQVKSEMDKDQREFILRRQLKAIQEELGEGDAHSAEIADLTKRIKEIKLPKEAAQEVERELGRLRNMPPPGQRIPRRPHLHRVDSLPPLEHRHPRQTRHHPRRAHPQRRPLRPRTRQAAHSRISRRPQAQARHPRSHPLLRRTARRRQDLPRTLHRPRARTQVRPNLPRRRPRRGRNPRPSPHLRRRSPRTHHPGAPKGRVQQPRLHARRN